MHTQKGTEFLHTAAGLLPCHRELSAHCMACCFQSWQELMFCRAGVGLLNRNWENRRKGWKFSAQTHRRFTPLSASDVSCDPSGDRRQEGAPIFLLNSSHVPFKQHDLSSPVVLVPGQSSTQKSLGPAWRLSYLSTFIAAGSGHAQRLWAYPFLHLTPKASPVPQTLKKPCSSHISS